MTAANGPGIERREIWRHVLFIVLVIGVPLALGTAPNIFRDGDVSWHVAAGNWIIDHGLIPATDPFSFTAGGKPWVATEWLAEIIYASAYRIAGQTGLALVVAVALMAVNAIVYFHLERRGAAWPWLSIIAMNVVLAPFALARPHVLAWPLLAAWTVMLVDRREKDRPPPLWSVLLLVLWTNLHTSFPLAGLVAAAIALDSVIDAKWKNVRQWLVFGLACLVAVMANANGLAGFLQPFHISGLEMLEIIGEWSPTTTRNTPAFIVVMLVGLGALLWRGARIPIGRLLLLLALLGLAFHHMRHQSAFIIIAACVIPPLFPSTKSVNPVPKALLFAAIPLLVVRGLVPITPPENQANPRGLIAAVPPELRTQPVLNAYSFGGPLILAGIKPYIDGRAELYGDEFVLDYKKMSDGDVMRFDRAVQTYGIRWAMLPVESALREALEASGKWKRIYADRVGVILVPS